MTAATEQMATARPISRLSSFSSRQEALDAIRSAKSWEDLFEACERGLFARRESWGDEPEQAGSAICAWAQAFFVVEAQERVAFSHEKAAISIRGDSLVKASFAMAQFMAQALLAPLPAIPRGPEGDRRGTLTIGGRLSFDAPIDEAIQSIKEKADVLATELIADGNEETPREGPLGALRAEALCGWPSHLKGWNLESTFRSNPAWVQSQILAAQDGLEQDAMSGVMIEASSAFKELCRAGGFGWVAAGPLAGWRSACGCAAAMAAACRDLSAAIEMPGVAVAGLGGLGMVVNGARPGSYASFHQDGFYIRTSHFRRYLGHEWTHALEFASANWTDCLAFRREALEAPWSGLADPDARAKALEALRKLSRQPVARARSFVAKELGLSKTDEEDLDRAFEALLTASRHKEGKGIKMTQKELDRFPAQKGKSQAKAIISLIKQAEKLSSTRLKRFEGLVQAQASAFLMGAVALDEANEMADYYASAREMLARTGEVFFAERSANSSLLSPFFAASKTSEGPAAPSDFGYPQGMERASALVKFECWLASCKPFLARICPLATNEFESAGVVKASIRKPSI